MKHPWLKLFPDDDGGDAGANEGRAEEGGDGAQNQQSIDFNRAMTGWQERTMRKVNETIENATKGLVRADDLESMFEKYGNGANRQQQPQKAAKKQSKGDSDSHDGRLETPVETELAKLRAELETVRKENSDWQQKLNEKDESISLEKFHSSIEQELQKQGTRAELAKQARIALMADAKVHQDAERGRLFEIAGEFCPEFVGPDEFVKTWLPSNTHFLEATKRGSGAGSTNSAGVPGQDIDMAKLATQSGIDAYLADPEKYRSQIEQQLQK